MKTQFLVLRHYVRPIRTYGGTYQQHARSRAKLDRKVGFSSNKSCFVLIYVAILITN